MDKRKEKSRIHIRAPSNVKVELNAQFARLTTELTELQRKGIKPKKYRFTFTMVKLLALKMGMEKLKGLSFSEFEDFYNKIQKKG